jgi:UDP-3-O-[3-hydroxymyristoyl] glucosamine N-acyltransferase
VSHTAQELAALVNGTLHGPAERIVRAAGPIHEAGPDHISFLEHERNLPHLKDSRAGVLVVPTGLAGQLADRGFTLIEVRDPLLAFVAIVQKIQGPPPAPEEGVSPQASVHPTAKLGPGCCVLPLAVVGPGAVLGPRCVIHSGAVVGPGCVLGADVVMYPNAVLYERTKLGDRVTVHAGAVLGADGFGYRFQGGKHVKVPQLGSVEVGDDVEIGANATIDRGTFQATRVGTGTKIDNLVMIAHNCRIGEHNLIVSQVGIAGSSTTGSYVVMAGQVGVADHVDIGDRVQIGASSKVPSDIAAGEVVLGTPALPVREAKRILVSMPKVPDLLKDVREIKKRLGMPLKEAG